MAYSTSRPAYPAARILAGLIGRSWYRQNKSRRVGSQVWSGVRRLMGSFSIYQALRTRAHGDGGKFKDLRISASKDILPMPFPPFSLLAKAGHPRGQIDVLGTFWRLGVCLY
jgi:hypothetical protein